MTRDEAIKWLDAVIAHLDSQRDEPFPEALEKIKKLIRVQPQPDPGTGLMKCGCGGSASCHVSYDDENWSTTVKIVCNKCLINVAFSALYELRGEEALADDAKRAWNTAMGWREKE